MQSTQIPVVLNPVPGFCVKSRATNDALVRISDQDGPQNLQVQKGVKVFVNVAWDPNVPPPPPPASDDAIQRAMQGLDIDASNPDAWFIPIVLSDARQDSDKAGQPAIVFDCVLHPSAKSRCLRDTDFKHFVIALAFQQIEAQTTLVLSRQIGTPNIAAKGKLQSRRVLVSTAFYPPGHPNRPVSPTLIQEIPDHPVGVSGRTQLKGILKTTTQSTESRVPTWSWSEQGSSIRIVFDVPNITRAVIPESTLDVEPRRVLLHVPAVYDLDLNLDAPDSEFTSAFGENDAALQLKRTRDLDVDNAKAEWRVADKTIVLVA